MASQWHYAIVCIQGVILGTTMFFPNVVFGQNTTTDPSVELRQLSRGTKGKLLPASAYDIAMVLAKPASNDASTVQAIANFLANEQLDWQAGAKSPVNEQKLLKALNKHLGLESAPEYLQLRAYELHKIRVNIWSALPDLSTGVPRAQATKGSKVIDSRLSPFEAYLAAGLLVYQKLFNSEYVRTAAEESKSPASVGLTPGLHAVQPNSRLLEFRQRVSPIVEKWSSPDAAVSALNGILGESRQ